MIRQRIYRGPDELQENQVNKLKSANPIELHKSIIFERQKHGADRT